MSKIVPPCGPMDADIMIVGESPGADEVRKGEPFVGASGRMLDEALLSAGIRRGDCYITNVSKQQPPKKGKDYWFEQNRPLFRKFLFAEVEKVQPKKILAIGGESARAFGISHSITKFRGSWETISVRSHGDEVEIPVLATVHPAWIMRGSWNKKPFFIWDVAKFAGGYQPPLADFHLGTPDERLLEQYLKAPWLAVDTEWYDPETLAYVGFARSPTEAIVMKPRGRELWYIRALLESDIPKIWQNAMFDLVFLRKLGYEVNGRQEDTMIGFHTLYPDLGQKDLGTLGSVYTDWPYFKDEVQFVGSNDKLGMEYNAKDCVVTYQAWEGIQNDLVREKKEMGYRTSIGLLPVFSRASVSGIRVDRDRWSDLRRKHLGDAEELEQLIKSSTGVEINVKSPKQVQAFVFDILKAGQGRKRTSNQATLMDIAASTPDPTKKILLTAIIRIRQKYKLVSSFLNEDMFDVDGRVRTSWNLAGTKSGRLSSSKPWRYGIPFQTIPESVRGIFVPDSDDYAFAGWDLRQAEARVSAALSDDLELLEAMDNGVDIHCLLGASLPFGLTYDELLALKKEKGGNFAERYLSKKLRHSLNYKGSWYTVKESINRDYLETGIGITAARAKELHRATMDIHPNLRIWWDRVKASVRHSGSLTNTFGRKRSFGMVGPFTDQVWREAISWDPQSTIADLTSETISNLDVALGRGERGQILAHMHDGGFAQVHRNMLPQMKEMIMEAGNIHFQIRGLDLYIPIDYKASNDSWGDLG